MTITDVKKWIIYGFVAAAALALMLTAPLLIKPKNVQPTLTYQVGGCVDKSAGEIMRGQRLPSVVEVSIDDSSVKLLHHLKYVCCADIKVKMEYVGKDGDVTVIRITEENVGEFCRCICGYDIAMKISDLQHGKYRIEIYGVKFEDMPIEKLWEGEVVVG